MTTEVVGMAEAAEIVGVSKSNFSAHRAKFNGEDECPPHTAKLTCGPVWAGPDVAKLRKWAKKFNAERTKRAAPTKKDAPVAKKAATSTAKKTAPAKTATAPAAKTTAPAKNAVSKTAMTATTKTASTKPVARKATGAKHVKATAAPAKNSNQ